MKANLVSKENNLATFTMEYTADEFEQGLKKAYNRNKGRYFVNGFRKGKAPQSIIEKAYGEAVFFEDGLDNCLNDGYSVALDELKLDPIDNPMIDFDKDMRLERGKPFKVIVKVVCAPVPELKKYKGLKTELVETKVTADDVKNELEALRKRNSRIVSVDRPAKDGDTVMLDYKGFVGEEQFEGGTAENQPLVLGSNTFIPGFEEQLVGVKAGESKDVKVTFPKDYHAENLAGKEAVFQCTVHEVKETELPALDDDFAAEASEFDTIADLKKDIKANLEKKAKEADMNRMKNDLVEVLIKENPFDVPDVMVEHEIDSLIDDFTQRLQYQGLSLDMYFQYAQTTMEEFRKSHRDEALSRVRAALLIDEVVKAESIETTDAEVEEEIKTMSDEYGMKVEDIKKILGANISRLKEDVRKRKAIDFLFENAELVEKKAPAKKTAKKAATGEAEEAPAEKKAPAKKKASPKKAATGETEEAPKKKAPAKKAAAKKEEK